MNPVSSLLKTAPLADRALGKMIAMKESANGLSHMTFLQDTLVAWLPKTLVARSRAELSETSFLEFLESFLIYYSMPLTGNKIFRPLMHKLAGKGRPGMAMLTRPLSEIPQSQLRKVLPVKAGMILATLATALFAGEYIINYSKNLMTSRVFKKEKFSDVVSLSGGQTQGDGPVAEKAKKRIKQSLGIAAGLVGVAALLARFGGSVGFLQKPLQRFVKTFDFHYAGKTLGLSRNQMMAYMGLAVPSYLDAARDNLERVEVGTRLALILPYLIFGQGFLEKRLSGVVGRKFPEVLGKSGAVKSLETIAAEAASGGSKAGVQRAMRAKSMLFGVPLAVGILGTGIGVGLMNRFFTAYRFRQQKKTNAQTKPMLPALNQRKSFESFARQSPFQSAFKPV